ncbi:MAG: hypothetical protein N2170_09820, partial [Bacteroidia bacterium]|nr:hypothetical protein [Bacteroidia bacterium]
MRYGSWLAGALLWAAIGWAQLAPWPLSKWQIYRLQGGQLVGSPLPERFLFPGGNYLGAVVDTVGMAAAGITGWRWELRPHIPSTYFPPAFSLNDTFIFQVGTQLYDPSPPFHLVRLVVWSAAGDTAYSYRTIQPYRFWGGVHGGYISACVGGEARIVVDFLTTDIDSLFLWVGQGGIGYDSIMVYGPYVWRFPAPSVAGDYDIRARYYLRGLGSSPVFTSTLGVVDTLSICISPPVGSFCVGQPVELKVLPDLLTSSYPAQVRWDFTGDGVIDATGYAARFSYSSPGTYTVQAYVEWAGGCRDTASRVISVDDGSSLGQPTLIGPGTYLPGVPISLLLSGVRGLTLVDCEDDGVWEGSIQIPSMGLPRTLPYRFAAPPPPGGYKIRVRQALCGATREDVLTWNPTMGTSVQPDGVIEVRGAVFCAGDSVTLRVRGTTNFSPGEAGYRVAWNFGSGWTAPTETAAETTIVWGGQPLSVQAQLYHPSGGTRTISGVSLSSPAAFRTGFAFTRSSAAPDTCRGSWCPGGDFVYCGGKKVKLSLATPPRTAQPWQWRLVLPTGVVTFPSSALPSVYEFILPTQAGVYTVE